MQSQFELMQAGFEYAPELRQVCRMLGLNDGGGQSWSTMRAPPQRHLLLLQVQDALLDDFTLRKLRGLQLGVKGALALFSNHIDKLEQLQVLHW